ncbi:MAG TPA: hypothetical protein VM865_08390 [Acidobacteriaceae bacterium]|jgi:hypothetical protein|nr:hypothetical protein [Acidobacteriaceae bacterium]
MILRKLGLALCLLLLPAFPARAQSPQLTSVLSQLDAASQRFRNARADFRWEFFEKIVHDTTVQTGSIYFNRAGANMEMGSVVFDLGPDGKPAKAPSKVLEYKGAQLQIFTPGVDQIDVFKAGANQAKYESFLTLGFGGSGKDLARAWDVTDNGPETINGTRTEKLDLVSKDPNVKNMFTHVTVWVDPTRGVSLQQKFFTPQGDVRTAIYSNIQVNTSLDSKTFAIRKDSHTTVIPH